MKNRYFEKRSNFWREMNSLHKRLLWKGSKYFTKGGNYILQREVIYGREVNSRQREETKTGQGK